MNRRSEVEVYAAVLAEPARSRIRDALVGLESGRRRADLVATLARARPALRWTAFLLALESAEMRLGGAARIETPRARFAVSDDGPGFVESWGAFGLETWPEELGARLRLAGTASSYVLTFEPEGRAARLSRESGAAPTELVEAVTVLAQELGAYLGDAVRVVEDLGDAPVSRAYAKCRKQGHAAVLRLRMDLAPPREELWCMRCQRVVDSEVGDGWGDVLR